MAVCSYMQFHNLAIFLHVFGFVGLVGFIGFVVFEGFLEFVVLVGLYFIITTQIDKYP